MKVVIRTDASLQIGSGHVIRCLTLAEELKKQGSEISFICRSQQGDLVARIEQRGFKTYTLSKIINSVGLDYTPQTTEQNDLYGTQWLGSTQQQDAEQCRTVLDGIKPDWLIVDHYGIDQMWQALLKGSYKKLMVIDDLANRNHQCELLLDQTYGRKAGDYKGLVPHNCQMLLGSEYALLRSEFFQWREYSLKRRTNPELKKLLISMGGVDLDNVTGKVLDVLETCNLSKELEITVVMGTTAPYIDMVKEQAKVMPYKTEVKTDVNNMAEVMANADLAIGAAGTTTWERCCLGLPAIIMMLSENQKNITRLLSKLKIALIVDKKNMDVGIRDIEKLQKGILLTLSKNATKIVDGLGVGRVIQRMQGEIK